KAQEANRAGKEPEKCILHISEGDSAKNLCIDGLAAIEDGSEYGGVLAIQGKFINVRNSSIEKVKRNKEFIMLCTMLNLKLGVDYSIDENFNTLRYHTIRTATDMDDDGIHIKGLLINLIQKFWPELIDRGALDSLSTIVVKVV